ncbi:hypothetical protein B484DRAFT_456902 [Ochromonadaceae sp. CCMP2298]|nr:hypothetical protein B484DRAFT_456902 [Ochromonadaceae sp. CCMP2298]
MKFDLLVLALLLVALSCEVAAHPTIIYNRCDREISVGATVMGQSAVGSISRSVIISRGGAVLSPKASYVPGETLSVTLSSTLGEYIFITTGATFPGGACVESRSLEASSTLKMPAAGAGLVTVKAAWALQYGTVTLTEDFTLIEGTATSPAAPTAVPIRKPKPITSTLSPTLHTKTQTLQGVIEWGYPPGLNGALNNTLYLIVQLLSSWGLV